MAIVGASEVPRSFTQAAHDYLLHSGFGGAIYPINPKWHLSGPFGL